MNKASKRLVKIESKALCRKVLSIQAELARVLEKEFPGRRMYRIRPLDALRLLVLDTWSERHRVSMEYILGILIPYWSKFISKRRGGRERKKGLGCRIATLVGRKSEEILKERIDEDFPQSENVKQWKAELREDHLYPEPDEVTRRKGMMDVGDPEVYVENYRNKIQRRRSKLSKAQASKLRRRRTYRGNPWL